MTFIRIPIHLFGAHEKLTKLFPSYEFIHGFIKGALLSDFWLFIYIIVGKQF